MASPSPAPSLEDEILTEERFGTKIFIMNRPKKLNALTQEWMLYIEWEKDPHVHLVILKGNGRGFCAGGDITAGYHWIRAGKLRKAVDFFRDEYNLTYLIGTYKKPHIAVLNGIVMGAGVGVSIHGRFRVATENTDVWIVFSTFAMPETIIGHHPDVGASYFLPRLPGHLGEYLGLTGARLDGADMLATSLATHFVPSLRLQMLEDRLGSLNTEDLQVISNVIDEHCDIVHPKEKSPLHRRTEIDSCFGRSSIEEIACALEAGTKTGNPWYQDTLNALKRSSPLSLKITLRSMREGRRQSLHECLQREFRLTVHAIEGRFSTDFLEGHRAVLAEKDNLPKWNPPVLEQITPELVEYCFSSVEGEFGGELQLPVQDRDPESKSGRYSRL